MLHSSLTKPRVAFAFVEVAALFAGWLPADAGAELRKPDDAIQKPWRPDLHTTTRRILARGRRSWPRAALGPTCMLLSRFGV